MSVSRFWRLVAVGPNDACWPWLGDSDADGYGIFFYRGRRRPAHEMALSFTAGEKRSEGFDTCHECDNPACCNPTHLRFDTRQANVDDMHARGRALKGEAHPSARLTDQRVREIRERRANGAIQKQLALDYGVSCAYISQIVNGRAWKEAGGPIATPGRSTKNPKSSHQEKAA